MSGDVPSAPVPSDYDPDDGWNEAKGLDMCPVCERTYSMNGGYTGAVYETDGTHYDHVLDTDPMDAPFICESCFEVLEQNRRQMANASLSEWVSGP